MSQIFIDGHAKPERPPIQVEVPGFSEPSFVEALISPAAHFRHPHEVVAHPWFSDEERRAVLNSWVRDDLVIESVALNVMPEATPTSRIDAVIEALGGFDPAAAGEYLSAVATVRRPRAPSRTPARRRARRADGPSGRTSVESGGALTDHPSSSGLL